MATEESTVGWHTEEETRYTDPGSATSQSESFVSLQIPFPKTKSQKSKLKFFLVFVSPFLLIGLILLCCWRCCVYVIDKEKEKTFLKENIPLPTLIPLVPTIGAGYNFLHKLLKKL